MVDITSLILTYNEKENIARTLAALPPGSEILIIDSFSTDGTIEITRTIRPDAVIKQRAFDSFAGQCNFGLTQIATEWVLSIDADYILTADLNAEIARLDRHAEFAGYAIEFRYCVFGRPLRSTLYPPRAVLYRRDCAVYRDEGHGHRVEISGKVQRLTGKIDHDDRKPLSRWIHSQDRYATTEARHLLATPTSQITAQDKLRRQNYFAPVVMFLYLLMVRGLILDGWRGWYYVCQRTIAEMLLSLRLLTERHGLEDGIDADFIEQRSDGRATGGSEA